MDVVPLSKWPGPNPKQMEFFAWQQGHVIYYGEGWFDLSVPFSVELLVHELLHMQDWISYNGGSMFFARLHEAFGQNNMAAAYRKCAKEDYDGCQFEWRARNYASYVVGRLKAQGYFNK